MCWVEADFWVVGESDGMLVTLNISLPGFGILQHLSVVSFPPKYDLQYEQNQCYFEKIDLEISFLAKNG